MSTLLYSIDFAASSEEIFLARKSQKVMLRFHQKKNEHSKSLHIFQQSTLPNVDNVSITNWGLTHLANTSPSRDLHFCSSLAWSLCCG